MKFFWSILFKSPALRNRVLFYLRNNYFHELGHSVPLGNDFWAYLLEHDAYDSFSEIFIQNEYTNYLPNEPISTILDIGAHYGYFSLWIQSKYPDEKIHSLMIEPSPKCKRSLTKLVNQRCFKGRFKYLQKAIDGVDVKESKFYDRSYMAGSIFGKSTNETCTRIETLKENDILNASSPPYDLIKCDIEGSEWEFINHYQQVIRTSKYLLLEWHDWHQGGGGFTQISDKLSEIHFKITRSSSPSKAVSNKGEVGLVLAKNLKFKV